ncbi:MAG: SGNH/GDSL hydrolase family protein [Pseudomonadota bacterium]|nr:SGNH/GDSL hydrolase family protein [Pseudomonadota bacterium]
MTKDSSVPHRHRPSRARRLAFALLSLVVVLGSAEAILRLSLPAARRISMPNEMIAAHLAGATFRFDPDLYWYWPASTMGVGGSPVNTFGFVRKKPMTMKKPAGVTRVVTFGDSQTFGAGMPPEKTYSAFAEEALGGGWEVLNAGISGYRTLNVYRLLRLRIEAFQPDAIVIDCMPYDSPRDDREPLEGRALGSNASEDLATNLRGILWHSRLYYVVRLGMEVMDPNRPRWLDQTHPGDAVPKEALGNHGLIQEWGREHGVEVFFMEYPTMDEEGQFGCMTNDGELPEGSRVVPTCKLLRAQDLPAPALFQDRNHLTEEGNRRVGRIVADSIRDWAGTK